MGVLTIVISVIVPACVVVWLAQSVTPNSAYADKEN